MSASAPGVPSGLRTGSAVIAVSRGVPVRNSIRNAAASAAFQPARRTGATRRRAKRKRSRTCRPAGFWPADFGNSVALCAAGLLPVDERHEAPTLEEVDVVDRLGHQLYTLQERLQGEI